MKEAIGGTWLFMIVILFLALFASYLCLSINYSRAFKVRDEIINIIENRKGIWDAHGTDTGAIAEIQDYLASVGHRADGVCDDGFDGYNLSSKGITTNKPVFCIKTIDSSTYKDVLTSRYYKVQVFYELDIPMFRQFFNSTIYGTTRRVAIAR